MKTRAISTFTPLLESSSNIKAVSGESGGRVFKGVTLIKAGLGNRRDRNFYPPETLKAATESGMFEGLRAYADHPTAVDEEIQPERTIRDMVGIYDNSRFLKEGDGGRVVANLTVLKSHKWLADTVSELVQLGHGDKLGISINGRGETEPHQMVQESGEAMDVNRVVRFVGLRSADVVTEAGAGGGFMALLESAKSANDAGGETSMDRKELLKALAEAAEGGDLAKVKELTAKLAEAEDAPATEVEPDAPADEADADPDADPEDGDEDGDETEEATADPDKAIDDAIEEAFQKGKKKADPCAEADDPEDCAEKAKAAKDEGKSLPPWMKAKEADEAEDEGETTTEAKVKNVPTSGSGNMTKKAGKKTTVGKKFGEGEVDVDVDALMAENHDLRVKLAEATTKLTKVTQRNERLAESLRVREKGDTAKKLLKESKIPAADRHKLVPRLMKLADAAEMADEIQYAEGLVESVVNRLKEDFGAADESYSKVEGAGSTIRESSGGVSSGDVDQIVAGSGLPLKKA